MNNMNKNPISKPQRPADDDCCGGGCCPCVWDTYNTQLAEWLRNQGQEMEDIKQTRDSDLK